MASRDDIADRVYAARGSARKADELVRDYLPFIKAETARFLGRAPIEGNDDELGIAMFAFHEAALAYNRERGAFLPLAARTIKHRLIDYRRRERRHAGVISLDESDGTDGEDRERTLLDTLDDGSDEAGEVHRREATRQEITEFSAVLASFGIDLAEVADVCPKQERTLEACRRVLGLARQRAELLDHVERTGKLPVAELVSGTGVDRKTIERHRKYLVALLIAFTNGYDIIRGHLYKLEHREGGER